MRRRVVGLFVVGSMAWLGAACNDDQGPVENPLLIEKPATKSGDQQNAPVGTALGNPLRVVITRDGAPVENVSVTWSAGQGGSFSSEQESDADGFATAVWTLGPQTGQQAATATVEDADGSPLTYTATATTGGGPPPGPTVQVRNNFFDPAIITISVGQTVTWVWANDQIQDHNVLPDAGTIPGRSGAPEDGPTTFSFTFTEVGTFRYFCQNHGAPNGIGMSGRVVVGEIQP